MRRFLILLVVVAVAVWMLRNPSSFSDLVDRITKPLLSSKAAVNEEEHKRVVADAAPAVGGDQETPVGMSREGMDGAEVRRLLGPPDTITQFKKGGRRFIRWDYPRIRRVVLLEDNRVRSVTIR